MQKDRCEQKQFTRNRDQQFGKTGLVEVKIKFIWLFIRLVPKDIQEYTVKPVSHLNRNLWDPIGVWSQETIDILITYKNQVIFINLY